MPIQINNLKDLDKILLQVVSKALDSDHLGKDIKEDVQKHIRTDVYRVYHPESYETTGQFHDSVVSSNPQVSGNSVEISVYNDPNLMTLNEPWYHQSVIDGSDIRENLAEIIELGETYDLWGHDDAIYLKPRSFMKNTIDEYKSTKKHVKKMVQYLQQQGINAKEG